MHRSVVTAAGFTLLLGILVVVAAVGGIATGPVAAQSTNETAIQHENPETVGQQGDTERVREWLSGRLTDRLRESSVRISQGQYERADDVFDDEFQRQVDQYVDVAGETDGGATTGDGGGDNADTEEETVFEQAQSEQTRLAALRAEFDETYTAYLDARQRGDSKAAREHARRLQQLARQIRELGGSSSRTLESIENETGANTEDIEQQTNRTVQNVTRIEEQVQTETFVETELIVQTNRTTATVADPVRVRARLATENDTAVANRSVRIRIGHVLFGPTTSANGTFAVTYRPAFVPVGAESVSTRYLPNVSSPYLSTRTNASLTIEATNTSADEPTLAASITPREMRFADEFTVATEVTVDGHPVVDLPIAIRVGLQPIGESTTAQTGMARTRARLPASVPPGNTTVQADVPVDNRAAGSVTAMTEVFVRETDTEISIDLDITQERAIVEGQLLAALDDETVGLPSQSVTVTLGETTRTVGTDTRGRFEARVPEDVVTSAADSESVRVRVAFDGSGTNVESARAETRFNASVFAGSSGGAGSTTDSIVPRWVGVGMVVMILLAVGGLAWRRRRRGDDVDETTIRDESGALAEESASPTDALERAPLAEARDAFSVGETDRAVIAAYGAVRRSLTDRFEDGETQTPREFLATGEQRLDSEGSTALQTLTEMYEQTVFAPEDSEAASQEALEAAQSLLETAPSERRDVADD